MIGAMAGAFTWGFGVSVGLFMVAGVVRFFLNMMKG